MVGDKVSVKLSEKLREFLKNKGKFGESFEEVIWRLIKEGGRE